MFNWAFGRKKDRREGDEKPLTHEELEALNHPLAKSEVVQALRWLVARADRKEIAQKREHRHSVIWKCASFLVFVSAVIWFLFGGIENTPSPTQRIKEEYVRSPILLTGNKGVAHVAFISISGDIGGEKYGAKELDNTEWYVQTMLEHAEENSHLAAVVLSITSYGGDATVSAHCASIIDKFRKRVNVPVIAFISKYAYSGGYYCALGTRQIVVDPDAEVGSVGVIMSWFSTQEIGKIFGVGNVKIATGPLKSCVGQWVELTPACRKSLERSIDVAFKRFLSRMAESRNIPLDTLIRESKSNTGRSNGGTFAAVDAVANGMADSSEDEDQLFKRLAGEIAKANPEREAVEFVKYEMDPGFIDGLTGATAESIRSISRFMNLVSNAASGRAQMRTQ